ncbi:MAG: hypothetical protein QG670_2857 [Thermoproteota archaeon]|nr:hypothetical protein [Thermoproteota archaeon]
MPFPKTVDYHKLSKPLIPNCYGIFYVLISVCYWFTLSFIGIMESEALALATSVLFGSTMGLFDDMADLKWRYKAILPIFAALPYMVLRPSDRTTIALLLFGRLDFGALFFLILVPIIVTVTTNTYNQLGGLNGLESLSGLIILIGLTISSRNLILTIVPIFCLIALGYMSYSGRAFIGNVGTFSIGLTLAVYAIIMNIKTVLLVALVPHIINSILILYSNYILHDKAETLLDEKGQLYSHRIRSLRTVVLHHKKMTEHQTVLVICLITSFSVVLGLIITLIVR